MNTLLMTHDLGTWGFILSVMALALMYPVGIFINLTSPAFQRFLARRSRAATVDRLEKIVRLHAEVKDEPTITEEADCILIGIQNVIMLMILCTNGILSAVFVISLPSLLLFRATTHHSILNLMALYFAAVGVPIFFLTYRVTRSMVRYRDHVSPFRRAEMEREIVELSAKLR